MSELEICGSQMDRPDDISPPKFELIVNESPDGAFFVSETDSTPDISRLVEMAKDGKASLLLMMALQEIGLMGNFSVLEEYMREHQGLLQKPELDETEQEQLEHLEASLSHYNDVSNRIHAARDVYIADYLGGEETSEPDRDKLTELYAATDDFNDASLLKVFEKLGERIVMTTDQTYRDNVNEADRIARILIFDEVYKDRI